MGPCKTSLLESCGVQFGDAWRDCERSTKGPGGRRWRTPGRMTRTTTRKGMTPVLDVWRTVAERWSLHLEEESVRLIEQFVVWKVRAADLAVIGAHPCSMVELSCCGDGRRHCWLSHANASRESMVFQTSPIAILQSKPEKGNVCFGWGNRRSSKSFRHVDESSSTSQGSGPRWNRALFVMWKPRKAMQRDYSIR